MKIEKIKINAFGKLQNLDINLIDNINIIHGNNESGKSTILKFILNSFYGSSRNKNGKDISDFEKYKPWGGTEFSGKLEYKLDNGEKYEIYREFNKKNPKVFNEKLEDISKQFNINKKGNDFFYEQTKIDEELFLSTSAIIQQEVKIGKRMQTTLIQKIANLVGTGDDNVSYKRAIDRLNRRQLEEIGTERSREKPINIIGNRIEKIKKQINELESFESIGTNLEDERIELLKNISKDEIKFEVLKEIKNIKNEQEIEKQKITYQEKIKNENINRLNLLKKEIEEIKINNKKNEEENIKKNIIKNKKIKLKLNLFFIFIILINIIQLVLIKNKIFNYIFITTVPVYLIFYLIFKNKIKYNLKNQNNKKISIDEKIINLENEIKLLEKNINNIENEINNLNKENNFKINLKTEKIKNNYENIIKEEEINKLINSENINYLIDEKQKEINNNKIKLHSLDLDKENLEEKLEVKSKLSEELSVLSEQYVNLQKLNKSMNLAKEVLISSYEKMKETVTPKFTEKLSTTISKITDGKYCNVKYNDELGLVTETKNGNYVLADRLSVGTIDQMYLALRLSIIKELSEENIPIFLDESFAYYDDERLENIIKFIYDEFNNTQIIIFTCTSREQDLFDKLNINYNLINI